ncbi:MAG: SAM domain-containing protein [Burkholderiales bacterium]
MLSFAEWLREAGLERYESVFAESDIDFTVVRKLTESDLSRCSPAPCAPRRWSHLRLSFCLRAVRRFAAARYATRAMQILAWIFQLCEHERRLAKSMVGRSSITW